MSALRPGSLMTLLTLSGLDGGGAPPVPAVPDAVIKGALGTLDGVPPPCLVLMACRILLVFVARPPRYRVRSSLRLPLPGSLLLE